MDKSSSRPERQQQHSRALASRNRSHQSHNELNLIAGKSNIESINANLQSARSESIKSSSRKLTVCLLCFVAAILSLSPYLSIHLTEQIGLLLFEADLVQLRSSQLSSAICFVLSLLIVSLIFFSNQHCDSRSNNIRELLVKLCRKLLPLAAIISSLAYLSIVLLVPHIKQVQRLPLATFDCDANLITIENCHQSYTLRGAKALQYILLGSSDINLEGESSDGQRLIRDINCIRYNDESLKSVQVPTNFLLHSCGLACRPQRQHYHQFGDDLNTLNETRRDEDHHQQQQQQHTAGQVSLKVCFSDEIGGSNYKQYCITNLADHSQHRLQDKTLTVGQLNALLRKSTATITQELSKREDYESTFSELANSSLAAQTAPAGALSDKNDDQATHYVNPIVQFESHFKNWPFLSNNQQNFDDLSTNMKSTRHDNQAGWCQFRPIPPFIVNNKPFSDIKCSIEHEYTMTTAAGFSQADRIYLKKSMPPAVDVIEADSRSQRCNIQCKVNILYQVRLQQQLSSGHHQERIQHYYLPMKPCNMISGENKKASIIRQCVIFRSIGDSALTICLVLIDLLLLIESTDTKQFFLEQNKSRFLGILLIVLIVPLLVALQFDLIQWDKAVGGTGHLSIFFNDYLMPYLRELSQRYSASASSSDTTSTEIPSKPTTAHSAFHFDNYLLPVFNFTIIIFILSIISKDFHISSCRPNLVSLVRISSTEELGLATTTAGRKSSSPKPSKTGKETSSLDIGGRTRWQWLEIMSFILISLALGTQFFLILYVQPFILRETLGDALKKYPATLFELSVHTGPALLVATLALLFKNELSTYFANFCPFNHCSTIDESTNNKNRAKFLKYICLASTVYSLRFILLANLYTESRAKLPILFLFYLSELFNFPLVWFALYKRAHELMMQQYPSWHNQTTPTGAEKAMRGHLVIQIGLALVYFTLARLVALTLHSLNVGLYLHSDNVDWFISGSQRQLTQTSGSGTIVGQQTDNSTITSDSSSSGSTNNDLFSPLPSERQTYLHASRLFLKYNSLVCLLMALILAANFLYVKYQLWSDQSRTLNVHHRAGLSSGNCDDQDNMNEFNHQLGMDLMQVRRESRPPTITRTRLIYPSDISNRSETSTSRAETPRAKVLFHYQLDRDKADHSRPQSTSSSSSTPSLRLVSQPPPPPSTRTNALHPVVRFIAVDQDDNCPPPPFGRDNHQASEQSEREIESTINYRNKTVRILEQDDQLDIPMPAECRETAGNKNGESGSRTHGERKRTISFAPEATFIGAGIRAHQTSDQQGKSYVARVSSTKTTRTIKTASPEPSIEDSGSSDTGEET